MRAFPIVGLEEVPGFLTAGSAWLLDGLARHQSTLGIAGDIAEVGVFYGRSALVLGRALAAGERLVACDSFEVGWDGVPGWSFRPSGPPEASLRERWTQWVGDPSSLVVIRGDSADLSPADLGGDCRIVHVDGGHGYEQVARDARLADGALRADGVIIFDDVLLPEWPDVTVAVVDHLRDRRAALVPFLVAEHKAFTCRPEHASRYLDWARQRASAMFPPPGHLVVERTFLGQTTTVVSRLPG